MLEKAIPMFRKSGLLNPIATLGSKLAFKMDPHYLLLRKARIKNQPLLESRRRRVLDAIELRHEPDRVPVIGNGVNFFPAKYAGITVAEYMYDGNKTRSAFAKFCQDFPLDMSFPSFMLALGRIVTATELNLLKIPGRDISVNSGYQYNEIDRLKDDEWGPFLQQGMPFLINTLAPRVAPLFGKKGIKRLAGETRLIVEALQYLMNTLRITNEAIARGEYNFFGTVAFPPYDVMSFVFRTISTLTRDLMRKQTRESVVELCRRMDPWLIDLFKLPAKMMGFPGVWFPSERAFSLSAKQFEQFYWPTLKTEIFALVKEGLMPFLTWESDVTHLIPFLQELPSSVARRCVFNCDTSDIFKAKKMLDGHMCIAGNVPLSTLCVGTPHEVEKYCEKLFEVVKPGGGFMLSGALGIPDEAKPENVHAMIRYGRKYGKY